MAQKIHLQKTNRGFWASSVVLTLSISQLSFIFASERDSVAIAQTSIKVDQNLDYIMPLCSSCQGVSLVHGRRKPKGESWKLSKGKGKGQDARLMACCLSPPEEGWDRKELHILQGAVFVPQIDEIAPYRPIQPVTGLLQAGHIPGLLIVLTTLGHFPGQASHPPAPLRRPAKPKGFLHCPTRDRLHSATRFLQGGTRKIWAAIRNRPFCEPPWSEVRFDPFPWTQTSTLDAPNRDATVWQGPRFCSHSKDHPLSLSFCLPPCLWNQASPAMTPAASIPDSILWAEIFSHMNPSIPQFLTFGSK